MILVYIIMKLDMTKSDRILFHHHKRKSHQLGGKGIHWTRDPCNLIHLAKVDDDVLTWYLVLVIKRNAASSHGRLCLDMIRMINRLLFFFGPLVKRLSEKWVLFRLSRQTCPLSQCWPSGDPINTLPVRPSTALCHSQPARLWEIFIWSAISVRRCPGSVGQMLGRRLRRRPNICQTAIRVDEMVGTNVTRSGSAASFTAPLGGLQMNCSLSFTGAALLLPRPVMITGMCRHDCFLTSLSPSGDPSSGEQTPNKSSSTNVFAERR